MQGAEQTISFLQHIAGPGAGAAVGWLQSIFFERWTWYQSLDSNTKVYAALGLSFVVPLLAVAGLVALGIPPTIDLAFGALGAGFAAFAGSQVKYATSYMAEGMSWRKN